MSMHPRADEDRHVQAPIEPCELPDGIELVYADNRDRRHTIALEDAAPLDFGSAKPFRKPPAYRGQRNFPGWWWSATTRSHIAYESWLERHHIIEADRDTRVTGISGQPFQLTWPEGKKNVRHVPDLFLLMIDGACVTDCRPADKMDKDFRHKAAVTAAACSAIGWEYRVAGDPDPTYSGGMFEGLMPNEVVPETSWGTHSFGRADTRTADVQIRYAVRQLHYPVWGMSPSSTPDDTGGYAGYGVEGLEFPYYGTGANAAHPNLGLSQCHGCATEDVITPYASFLALDVAPEQAYANIQRLPALYPGVYGADGFFDAVSPATGSVGHRYLVLDQSMIMAALDNALNNRAIQRDFARDPVSWAARTYLSLEHMSI
jgi:hypothetical protein